MVIITNKKNLEIKQLPLGPYQTNCYILTKENEVIVIDPSAKGELIASHIPEDKKVLAVLLTHGHFDHFGGAQVLLDKYCCPLYIHEEDVELIEDPFKNLSMEMNMKLKDQGYRLEEGILSIGSFQFSVLHTPGHSPGSVSLHIEDVLFCGDLIFKGSIGRTDLYGSNERQMKQSLEKIKTFSQDLILYSGHGPKTTLNYEKRSNPFLNGMW